MAKKPTIGWISLHRQIQDHWIWKDANKFKWWIDILLTVNNTDAKVSLGLEVFDCKRGESLLSLSGWANRWGVHKDTARNFLKLLEKDEMIKCVNIGKSTRLTVCKYECYQLGVHVKPTDAVRETNTNNNDNNINLKINNSKTDFEKAFDDFSMMRKKIRKPLTDRAVELVNLKLDRFSEGEIPIKIQILEQSTLNSWQDVFPLRPENMKQQKINGTNIHTGPRKPIDHKNLS